MDQRALTRLAIVALLAVAPAADARTAADASTAQRAAVAHRPDLAASELVTARVMPLRAGALYVFERRHHGRRVLGGRVAVRAGDRGELSWMRARELDLGAVATRPRLEASAALDRARAHLGVGPGRGDAATLVVDAPPRGRARLVYAVTLAEPAALRAARVVVDADTGAVLRSDDLVRAARAEVFAENPAVGDPALRIFTRLPAGATTLESPELRVEGCPDTGACLEVFPQTYLHACEPSALAVADDAGDFLAYQYEGDRAPDDIFAEVQAYAHLETALSRLESLGAPPLDGAPLRVLVNYRAFDPSSLDECATGSYQGDIELQPFDNAFFAPGGQNVGVDLGDALVLGQGRNGDYAYDLDVVTHELGHAFLATLAPDLGRGHLDEHGFDPTPAALQEALPDLLAVAVTGDPVLGEYIGAGLGDGSPVRDLRGDARCPGDLDGRAHHDARVFAQALWSARDALGEARADGFDAALLVVLASLDAYADFEVAAELMVSELGTSLGADAADLLAAKLAERGLPGCGDRVVDRDPGRMTLFSQGGEPYAPTPAPLQRRFELEEPADAIVLLIDFYNVSVPPEDVALTAVVRSGEAISWRLEDGEAVGRYDREVEVVAGADGSARAVFPGPFAPGDHYLMLVNHGPQGTVHGLRTGYLPAAEIAGDDGGCGCRSSGPSGAGLALLGLTLAATRRRDRDRSRRRR